jgi:hypothetical protein
LGKIEFLDRYTGAPGPGVEEGTAKQVETNTPFARVDAPFRFAPQWELNFRAEIPVVWTNGVTPENSADPLRRAANTIGATISAAMAGRNEATVVAIKNPTADRG